MAEKSILDPERELTAPHDMLIEAEEKDGKTGESKIEKQTTQPTPKKRSFPIWLLPLLALLIILLAGGMYILNAQKETATVAPPTQPTPTITPTPDPIAGWSTYQNELLIVKYPPEYLVEELEGNYVAIYKNEKSASGEAGINIDARLLKENADYDKAVTATKDNLAVGYAETEVPSGIQLSGKIGKGLGKDLPLIKTLYRYNNGAITIESSGERMNYPLYNQILTTFRLTEPESRISPTEDEGVMCTMDAKICPDGSTVGRTGPNCTFAACPE